MTSPNEATARLRNGLREIADMATQPLAAGAAKKLLPLLDQRAGDVPEGPSNQQVRDAMQIAWNDFCDDAQAHPGDIRRVGRKTYFVAGTWADHTAMQLRAMLAAAPTPTASSPIGNGGAEAEKAADVLRSRLRNIVAHATGGKVQNGDELGLNDICVAISALRNVVYQAGKDEARTPAASSADAGLVEALDEISSRYTSGASAGTLALIARKALAAHRAQEPQS